MKYLKIFNFFRNLFRISFAVFVLDILGYVFQNYLIIKKSVSVYGLWNFDVSTEKLVQFLLYYGSFSFIFMILFFIFLFALSRIFDFDLKLSNNIFKFIGTFLNVSDDDKKSVYKLILDNSSVYVGKKSKKIILYIFVPSEHEKRIYDNDTLRILADDLVQRCQNFKNYERCSASMWQDELYQNKKYKVLVIQG